MKIKRVSSAARITKIASLTDLLKEDVPEVVITGDMPKDYFSQENLTEAWMDFAYSIKKVDLDFFSTLSSFLPHLGVENDVKIVVHNSTQSADITKMKKDLLGHIRKALNNYDFDFIIDVNKAEAKDIAVTPQEKYNKLKEKNPLLDDLRKKLDLGF